MAKAAASKAPLAAVEDPDDDTTAEAPAEATEAPAKPEDPNTATVVLKWKHLEFTIPKRRGRWPVRALREFNRGRNIEGLVALIGEDGWARLELACPFADEFEAFSDYAGDAINANCVP